MTSPINGRDELAVSGPGGVALQIRGHGVLIIIVLMAIFQAALFWELSRIPLHFDASLENALSRSREDHKNMIRELRIVSCLLTIPQQHRESRVWQCTGQETANGRPDRSSLPSPRIQ